MSVGRSNTPDIDDSISIDSDGAVRPQMTMHASAGYSGMPMHMYPYDGDLETSSQSSQSKRRQVKNACINCQKACKKCDDARPCLRCVRYGVSEECVDSQRRERRRGVKRGPYKKRDGKDPERIGDSPDQDTSPGPPGVNTLESSSSGPPPAGAFMTPVTFGPGFYGQYAMPQTGQPGEAPPTYFPQFYIAQPPQPPPNPDGNPQAYSQPQYFPAFVPFGGGYAPYMVQRPDGQIVPSYAMYARPPGAETPSDPVMTSRVEHVVAEEKEEEPGDPSV
ncbi:hypothetical protein FIBSPDRAFT_778142 [Athelia psychrophila]|uniref:Transcription activator of gluconeogenesis ERT1 n=1 Tax=Athelia psychrophila TaxID=1759441 RepID=A0A166SYQ0_9AGAM|nr:hypothetical protein FIBSPDRAFT_778142 [Fibularhizoctonia sp. CBS 109695]